MMDEHPSTPDSEHTIRGSNVASRQSLRQTRLYELGDTKHKASPSSGLNPAASPFKFYSPRESSTPGLVFEDSYPSQRFRPIQPTQHSPEDSFRSHTSTFVPPDSPEMSSLECRDDCSGDDTLQKPQLPSTKPYTGVRMAPGQLSTLTTYGILSRDTHPAKKSGETSSGDSCADTPFTPSSTHGRSDVKSFMATPGRHNPGPEKNTGHAGQTHRYGNDGKIGPYDIAPQTTTFAQLARERGLREWNNSEFDDRWMLQPDELGKSQGTHKSAFSSTHDTESDDPFSDSPSKMGRLGGSSTYWGPSTQGAQSSVAMAKGAHPGPGPQHRGMQERDHQINSSFNSSTTRSSNQREGLGLVPLPAEAGRYDALLRDIEASDGIADMPVSRRIIRQYIYQRCFGSGDRPEPLTDAEARLVTVRENQRITLGELRDNLIDDIEDLILQLKTKNGRNLLSGNHSADLGDNQPSSFQETNRASVYKYANRLRVDGRDDTGKEGRTSNQQATGGAYQSDHPSDQDSHLQRNKMLAIIEQQIGQDNHGSEVPRAPSSRIARVNPNLNVNTGPFPSNQGFHTAQQQPGQQHELPASFGRLKLGRTDEDSATRSSSDARTALNTFSDEGSSRWAPNRPFSRFGGSSTNDTNQSVFESATHGPWSSTYSSLQATPYTSPEKNPFGGYPNQQHWPQTPHNLTPAQLQYMAYQQMQNMGPPQMPPQMPYSAGQPPPMGFPPRTPGGVYGPNGIWVPNDRFVRPPAANRMAPLFAHSTAWPGNANPMRHTPTVAQHPEWSNRFGTPTPGMVRDNRKLAYVEGSDDMYPQPPPGSGASVRYQNLTRQQPPSMDVTTNEANVPFVETARASKPAEWGVMKIGNIPYDISKSAVVSFLGNHAKLITPELGPAVHVIMDRATGKTQDCYVEFFSTPDAMAWVRMINSRSNQANRIGDRVLDVHMSSQADLLKELFPRAKNISWEGGKPSKIDTDDPYNSGFKTFVSAEELASLSRHAEQPRRSVYTQKCPNRPYEAMISLLTKFPWQATSCYSMATRNKIFDAALKMLYVLNGELRRSPISLNNSMETSPVNMQGPFSGYPTPSASGYTTPAGGGFHSILPRPGGASKPLNPALLKELLSAALNASGFSEMQRSELNAVVDPAHRVFLISPLTKWWPFQALGRRRGIEEDVVEWYARLIGSHPNVPPSSCGSPFGNVSGMMQGMAEDATMEEVGEMEWNVMVRILMDQASST